VTRQSLQHFSSRDQVRCDEPRGLNKKELATSLERTRYFIRKNSLLH